MELRFLICMHGVHAVFHMIRQFIIEHLTCFHMYLMYTSSRGGLGEKWEKRVFPAAHLILTLAVTILHKLFSSSIGKQ